MSKSKTLDEWREFYKQKTGDEPELLDGFRLFYLAERGYAAIKIDEDASMVIISETCGDGKFWHDFAELIATSFHFKCMATMCIRPIKPYIRSFGWQVEKAWLCLNPNTKRAEDRYLCRDSVGRPVVITLACYDGKTDSRPQYWITQYLNTTTAPKLELSPDAIEITDKTLKEMEAEKHNE